MYRAPPTKIDYYTSHVSKYSSNVTKYSSNVSNMSRYALHENSSCLPWSAQTLEALNQLSVCCVGVICVCVCTRARCWCVCTPGVCDCVRYSTTSTRTTLGAWSSASALQVRGSTIEGDLWGFDGSSQSWKRRRFSLNGLVSTLPSEKHRGTPKSVVHATKLCRARSN